MVFCVGKPFLYLSTDIVQTHTHNNSGTHYKLQKRLVPKPDNIAHVNFPPTATYCYKETHLSFQCSSKLPRGVATLNDGMTVPERSPSSVQFTLFEGDHIVLGALPDCRCESRSCTLSAGLARQTQ